MARGSGFDTAGSQFFIVHGDSNFLDGSYAAFGKVLEGMDVVDKLADTPVTDGNGHVDRSIRPVIAWITIDSDVDLPEPEKLR
jgi:peptidyl-prolyl cis-trans isomerase B (cyclophilin B)